MDIKLISWNVNGIRAVSKKGFSEWFHDQNPDFLCLQETKARPEQLTKELLEPENYVSYWSYPEEVKGYSGVAVYCRQQPISVSRGIGVKEFDIEGRILIVQFTNFTLCNVYFPKGDTEPERRHRLDYKLAFYDSFLEHIDSRKARGEKLIICGDFNTAHKEIDLTRPRENEKTSGFLPEERAWIDKLVAHGYNDTFRLHHSDPDHYTWWDYKTGARKRNVGWRLDYFFVSDSLKDSVKDAGILTDVMGSDHCPVMLTLKGSQEQSFP
jgi:exodeoxyribonuclease III